MQVPADVHVTNLASPDFRPGSDLMRMLTLAVERLCKQIALRAVGAANRDQG